MEAIKTIDLCKEYKGVRAVRGLDLSIEEGTIFALLGVNGAGKTTTVRMLSGLTVPTSGDALIFGHSVVREPYAVKSMIDISMQETAVARNLTVRENLAFYAAIAGLDKREAAARIDEVTERFNFGSILDKRAKTLSGGWQRKLSISLALLSRPRVLFLDEPTLGLDVLARRELWSVVEGLKGSMTMILTTHYMEEAEKLADRIGVMKDGCLLICGTAAELIEQTGAASFEDAFVSIIENGGAA